MLTFEIGDAGAPAGHAIAVFRGTRDPDAVAACYLVVPPVQIDLTRYVPAMLAGQIPGAALRQVQAIPLPPVPERAPSLAYLRRLATLRRDDLVVGQPADPDDVERSMAAAAEAAQEYFALWRAHLAAARLDEPAPDAAPDDAPLTLEVGDVLYEMMGEHDRLMELAKLVGRLRYAIEGGDRILIDEADAELRRLARHLAPKYRPEELVASAGRPGPAGQRLVELYVERCFKMVAEDYRAVGEADRRIRELAGEP